MNLTPTVNNLNITEFRVGNGLICVDLNDKNLLTLDTKRLSLAQIYDILSVIGCDKKVIKSILNEWVDK